MRLKVFGFWAMALLLASCQPLLIKKKPAYDYLGLSKNEIKVHKKAERFLEYAARTEQPVKLFPGVRIDSVNVSEEMKKIQIYFNKSFSFTPFREENVRKVYEIIRGLLGSKFKKYDLQIYSLQVPIEELIPNFYRSQKAKWDVTRLPKKYQRPAPLVRPEKPWKAERGLEGKNIVLWNSHGWYFNHKIGRWEWQRPRLFQSVEDLLTTSFVLPFLAPMLENAGAYLFLPRERDMQTNEVIVDNDSTAPAGRRYSETILDNLHFFKTGHTPGFALGHPPYEAGENPFKMGTHRYVLSDSLASAIVRWTPVIPQTGYYAVYVSYHSDSNSVTDADYTVFHAGGKTAFKVNQTIGGGTWIYLGTFKFRQGFHPDSGSVRLTNLSKDQDRIVSADAVRFGGGMGNVAREGQVSGRPRFVEAARYYLQFAGMPDTLVYNFYADSNDYVDDYKSRGEYANYLYGKPFGPSRNRQAEGLKIPIDLSFAFHTDAGITHNDTTIGTLAIYSLAGADSQRVFPDSVSRMANRDFADILQTQIVHDIQAQLDPVWQRRPLYEAYYSEAFLPNMPAALLELLSHQNFRDMQMALDPRFRFVVSRAIYKAMLKFIASQNEQPFVVQPLPVTHFQAVFDSAGRVILSWKPTHDPLELTAEARSYIVFTRIDSFGFDNGFVVQDTFAVIDSVQPGKIYSFKVCALNAGGKSFPSEILSIYRSPKQGPVLLIVNGFDRICAPSYFKDERIGGFLGWLDNGVPYKYDPGFVGLQYDLKMDSKFLRNDAPGFGASFADYETRVTPGNTFDFVYEHGKAIKAAGYSFVSCSDEALMDGWLNPEQYPVMDLILGEEKRTPWPFKQNEMFNDSTFAAFPERLQRVIKKYLVKGNGLFVSGAYVASDLFAPKEQKYKDIIFAKKWLRFVLATDHAARTGKVKTALRDAVFDLPEFRFNTGYHPQIYAVESPDALNPMSDSWTCLRYAENDFSAGVAFKGYFRTITLGFPFETILDKRVRNMLMEQALRFLLNKKQ
ncbi:golvesin C-terminal-like domain-containing protein [Calditrichota bacterium GD2]